ncbi:MAG: hypothetical protein QOJ54_442 [Aliidongia sp.]|jgi:hypothetical protein|nr:hypothetical protein [Aliidongia sp.]
MTAASLIAEAIKLAKSGETKLRFATNDMRNTPFADEYLRESSANYRRRQSALMPLGNN